MGNGVKYLLIVCSVWSMLMCCVSCKMQGAEQSVSLSRLRGSVWNTTFGWADRHLNTLYKKIVDNSLVKKISDSTVSSCRVVQDYRVYEDIACGAGCAALAYRYRHDVLDYVTWSNVAYGASVVYFINRLFPDWLKDCVSKIPLFGKLMDFNRFKNCHVKRPNSQGTYDTIYPEKSSSFAIAEYALGAGIVYSVRNYLSCDTIAKAALVCYLLNFISPKCKVIKIPVLRRLLI